MSINETQNELRDVEISGISKVNASGAGFPTPVNGVITLESTIKYIITQQLVFDNVRWQLPDDGQVWITSLNALRVNIISNLTGGDALFIGDPARVVIQDVNFVSTTSDCLFYNVDAVTTRRPVFIHQRSLVSGYGTIGTIKKAITFFDNIAYFDATAGITLTDNGNKDNLLEDIGNNWNTINFQNQGGDHITLTGTTGRLRFSDITGAPSTGDKLYEIDAVNSQAAFFDKTAFSGTNGGILGTRITYDSDTTLGNVFEDIDVDTTSNAVEITLTEATANLPDGTRRYINDSGNAGTNAITVIPHPDDDTTIDLEDDLIINVDGGAAGLELRNGIWNVIFASGVYGVHGGFYINENTTVTTISSSDTYTDISGTGVAQSLRRFTYSSNTITYEGNATIKALITVSASIRRESGESPRMVRITLFKEGVEQTGISCFGNVGNDEVEDDVQVFSFTGVVTLSTNDTLKSQIRNETNNSNLVVTDLTLTAVKI